MKLKFKKINLILILFVTAVMCVSGLGLVGGAKHFSHAETAMQAIQES